MNTILPRDYADDETCARYAAALLSSRPHPSSMRDERLYASHAPALNWAERGDDLLAESNYECVLAELEGMAARNDTTVEPDDVIDATISDWLVGSLRQIFVRVADICPACEREIHTLDYGRAAYGTQTASPVVYCETPADSETDNDTECPANTNGSHTVRFAEAWRAACAILDQLADYPVWDESDYSERQSGAFDADFSDALDDADRQYDDDDATVQDIRDAVLARRHDGEEFSDDHESADWDAVAKAWDEERDAIYEARAALFGAENGALDADARTPIDMDPMF